VEKMQEIYLFQKVDAQKICRICILQMGLPFLCYIYFTVEARCGSGALRHN
jgi:hypothetical protein